MEIKVVHSGMFKLDGGAMFGVVPKVLWERTNPADENNLCTWAMRNAVVKVEDRIILIDTGIGNKQSEKFFSHYHLHGSYSLLSSLQHHGIKPGDITDVFHTHLHFDHCGGTVIRTTEGKLALQFPNATHHIHRDHWDWATSPNSREKASFLEENILPIQDLGKVKFHTGNTGELVPGFEFRCFHGHTDHQMIPFLTIEDKTLVFMADLLPSTGHIPLPFVMGYDTRPLLTLEEKRKFLEEAAQEEYILFLQHDPVNECCTVKKTEKGVRLDAVLAFDSLFKNS